MMVVKRMIIPKMIKQPEEFLSVLSDQCILQDKIFGIGHFVIYVGT